jgi:glycerophosphoryl diester phosphodiesterase
VPVVQSANLFPELPRPYLFAHQGGEALAPTNTMAAFAVADSIGGSDFLDIDVHMTRDGHLVGIHDPTVDRTTNAQGRVDAYTLEEIQQLDAGYWFRDVQGEYSYRGKGVKIPSLEEFFEVYAKKYYLHFEIKDAYPKNAPSQIEAKLWTLIQRYHMEQRVIVASFHQAVIRRFRQCSQGKVVIGAGRPEVTNFVLANKLHLSWLYRPFSQVLEIPCESAAINLKKRSLIEDAHRRGMEVYYWTVDDVSTMEELLVLGADGLYTNRPDLLKTVIQKMRLSS